MLDESGLVSRREFNRRRLLPFSLGHSSPYFVVVVFAFVVAFVLQLHETPQKRRVKARLRTWPVGGLDGIAFGGITALGRLPTLS